MRGFVILFVLISVILSSGSQIALKYGMTSPLVKSAVASSSPVDILIAVISSPLVVLGLFCFGLSAVVWLYVLNQIPLSSAYPFVALGIGITTFAGYLLFGEAMPPAKVFGVCLVIAGVLTVAVAT